jgi:hypothetical protein
MSDPKLQAAYAVAEEKRRRAAIARDRETLPFDFDQPFDPIDNPGAYAEDPIWKRYWKTEGIRAVNPDGSIISDAMERFRQAFELGYMACRKIEKNS